MRIALVHDYLNQYGGAERVLETLIGMFPRAPIITLLYDKEKTFARFDGRVTKTSFLDMPLARRNHRLFLPLFPLAARAINLGGEYDLIISDSAGYAKGVRYDARTKHISYCHTPLRYAWENRDYVQAKFGNEGLRRHVHLLTAPVAWYLRLWDKAAGQKPDLLLANSAFIAQKIRDYYGRTAPVLYPPVDTGVFYRETGKRFRSSNTAPYYLAVGRLLHYKRFDLLIDAFKELRRPLRIVGDGPERAALIAETKRCGAEHITIEPFVENDAAMRRLYNEAQALLFPQVEDFGLVAAEAQACGLPVIAYNRGGASEIVEDGKTGVFFHAQTPEAVRSAVKQSEKINFDRAAIVAAGKRFERARFKAGIEAAIASVFNQK